MDKLVFSVKGKNKILYLLLPEEVFVVEKGYTSFYYIWKRYNKRRYERLLKFFAKRRAKDDITE